MVNGRRVHVVVEIERTAATVSGQTCVGPAAAVDFYGWLELIDQLQDALGQPPPGLDSGGVAPAKVEDSL
jgi:hypothetical protein